MTTEDMAALIEHRPWCTTPQPVTYLKRRAGDGVRTKCRTCGRGVDHDDPMRRTDHDTTRAPVSHYRCRVHTEQATTWRGTGCPTCATEKSKRTTRRERRAARRARREAEDYLTTTTEGEHG